MTTGGLMESKIIVNGYELTEAQSMTLRVALESFASDLHDNGLGDDDVGKRITTNYLARIDEIREVLYQPAHKVMLEG